jgi:hypothetical protein
MMPQWRRLCQSNVFDVSDDAQELTSTVRCGMSCAYSENDSSHWRSFVRLLLMPFKRRRGFPLTGKGAGLRVKNDMRQGIG